jgi:hypothetical protein
MKNWRISRRTLLRGTGAWLALPLLEVMTPLSARAATRYRPPVRLGCLYLPNGSPESAWNAEVDGDGRILSMADNMRPFEPFKEDLQLITGLESELRGSHPAGGATWLIRPAPEGDGINARKGVGGISMDQLAAKAIGNETLLSSLELIMKPQGSFSSDILRNNISWSSPTTPAPRETEPLTVFRRLTGETGAAGGKKRDDRKTILDTVMADANSLRSKASTADRDKLDEYFESVREVEKRLALAREDSHKRKRAMLTNTAPPPGGHPENHQEYMRLMFDMMVLAYWTDSTRVASFMLDHEQSNRYFDFIPEVRGMWHALSHWGDISGKTEDDDGLTAWTSKEVKRQQYLKVIHYHHQQVAYFFERLRSIKEGGANLLDNCVILYGSPFEDGNKHASKRVPVMLAGKAGGKLRTGRQLSYEGQPREGIYISILDALGVHVEKMGNTDKALSIV